MDRGKGVAAVVLLWPVRDQWPPEIDFAEDGGATNTRRHVSATLHYGAHDTQIQRTVHADFTRWHTVGVEWTPGRLSYTLDRQALGGRETSAGPRSGHGDGPPESGRDVRRSVRPLSRLHHSGSRQRPDRLGCRVRIPTNCRPVRRSLRTLPAKNVALCKQRAKRDVATLRRSQERLVGWSH